VLHQTVQKQKENPTVVVIVIIIIIIIIAVCYSEREHGASRVCVTGLPFSCPTSS
jgi:hypothetical protein